ncbi:MAG TPA: hypothetical protein VF179_02610 [Thermoanaerobaculia bacterium]|nr:hypothetical protein [Thermoanaerobaculia bacterium]
MRRAVFTALAVALCASALSATSVLYVPIERSIDMSDAVLVGHVLRMEAAYNAEGEIVTRIDLLVEESLKGDVRPGEIFTFDAWGGSLDGVNVETVGEARYRLGQKVLVQLESINGEYHTLGLSFGKWDVGKDAKGAQWISRSLADLNVVGVTEVPVERMPLRQMREAVRERPAF